MLEQILAFYGIQAREALSISHADTERAAAVAAAGTPFGWRDRFFAAIQPSTSSSDVVARENSSKLTPGTSAQVTTRRGGGNSGASVGKTIQNERARSRRPSAS